MLKYFFRKIAPARPIAWIAALVIFSQQSIHAETPEQFVRNFAQFKFSYHEKIQDPQVFLSTKSGDCDDFATLAAVALAKSGYTTRLFAVRMKGETHVVCYVPKAQSYLDYNNRADRNPLVTSDGSLRDVADKVAESFGRDWLAAYEFSYREKMKWLVNTILHNKSVVRPLIASK